MERGAFVSCYPAHGTVDRDAVESATGAGARGCRLIDRGCMTNRRVVALALSLAIVLGIAAVGIMLGQIFGWM